MTQARNTMTGCRQVPGQMAANESAPAGNPENSHGYGLMATNEYSRPGR